MYKCHCGEVHDNAAQGHCPQVFTLQLAPLSADDTGREIRRLLLALRAPEHKHGTNNYATDEMRRRALEVAGICWLAPGEMAPTCCCDWSPEHPEGPRLRLEEDQSERRKLWADECITRAHASSACSRGTKSCVVKHRGGVG